MIVQQQQGWEHVCSVTASIDPMMRQASPGSTGSKSRTPRMQISSHLLIPGSVYQDTSMGFDIHLSDPRDRTLKSQTL